MLRRSVCARAADAYRMHDSSATAPAVFVNRGIQLSVGKTIGRAQTRTPSKTARTAQRLERELSLVDVLDRPCPIHAILGCHVSARSDAGVLIAVLADVEEILSAGNERAATNTIVGRRAVQLSLQSREQLANDVRRDAMSLGRIHETEENQID